MISIDILDALVAAPSITLRVTTFIFVRYHPLGARYLRRIYYAFSLYAIAVVGQLCIVRKEHARSRRNRILSLVLGWVDIRRPVQTLVGVLINISCLVSVLDFLYRGHVFHQSNSVSFARLGYVDNTTAKIVVRAPTEGFVTIEAFPDSSPTQVARATVFLDPENDLVGTLFVEDLLPDTDYTYYTNANHMGTFKTTPSTGESLNHWSLISTSCIKPFFPYNPLSHGLRIPGLEHLDNCISSHSVDMMLFLGDFIYVDLPVSLGWDPAAYTSAYRQVYASPSWTTGLRNIPWVHVYDDHEIINDWANNETGLYQTAMKPFWNYQGHANPRSEFGPGQTYFTLNRGDISFFVLDTRRYRSALSVPDGPDKTMLGREQLSSFEQWLNNEPRWKVVVSSVPFTRNWRGPDAADSWAGYIRERDYLLNLMKQTGGAVILSGDRHEHATTLFPAKSTAEASVIEFSTSPLNQFYEPFHRFHKEIEDTDISIYSHPWGTSKFGVVTFNSSDHRRLLLHYDLFVDGVKVWEYDWVSKRPEGLGV